MANKSKKDAPFQQKCVYFRAKVLSLALQKAENEDLSFSAFVNRAIKFYLENHRDLFDDVDTLNPSVS